MKTHKNYRLFRKPLAAIALGAAGLLVYQANQQSDPIVAKTPIKSRLSHRDTVTRTGALPHSQAPFADTTAPPIPTEIPVSDAPHQVFKEFNDWAVTYSKATPTQQKAMLADGEIMVKQRHEQMADLIEKSPQTALDEADSFSPLVREALPESLKDQLEQPVNARGDLNVTAYLGENTVPYERTAIFGNDRYTVFPAGEDEMLMFEPNRSLLGIKLAVKRVIKDNDGKLYPRVDKLMALRKTRVRVLKQDEVAVAMKSRVKGTEPSCEVSQKSVAIVEAPAAIETGGDTKWMCQPDHATAWLKSPAGIYAASHRGTYAAAGGPGEGSGLFYPIPEGKSTGVKNSLCATFRCSGQTSYLHQGFHEKYVKDALDQLATWSYGKVKFATPTYTPLFDLPHTAGEYAKKTYSIRDDATAELKRRGYNLNNYAFHMVLVHAAMNDRDGGADIGGTFIEIGNPTSFVIQHEVGHILGLPHANLWVSSTSDPIGPGYQKEYGGAYDTMGRWPTWAPFNTMGKFYIRWLTLNETHDVARGSSSTYTIYDPDVTVLTPGLKYTIRIARSDGTYYFVEFRPRATALTGNAIVDVATQNGIRILRTTGAEQVDCTPFTQLNGLDGTLLVGQEFYDAGENITIKAISKGVRDQKQYFDVSVSYNRPTITSGRTYMLRAKEGNLMAGVANSSGENGAQVTQQNWQGSANQKWVPIKIDSGYYKIVNVNSGKVLEVYPSSLVSGRFIRQWNYVEAHNQKWKLVSTDDNSFKLINVYSGLALSSPYPRTQTGIPLEQYTYTGSNNLHWVFDEVNPLVSGGTYKVTARHSGKVLEIPGTNAPNGTAVRQWGWFGSMNQRWITTWLGGGQQSISNASSNKVLEVGGLSNSNGVIIQQWSWAGHNWQKWTLEAVDHDAGGFWYQIVNVGSGKVASVNDVSLYDGAGVQQWPKWGLTNQQWRFSQ